MGSTDCETYASTVKEREASLISEGSVVGLMKAKVFVSMIKIIIATKHIKVDNIIVITMAS
jgi:hypothetical protein